MGEEKILCSADEYAWCEDRLERAKTNPDKDETLRSWKHRLGENSQGRVQSSVLGLCIRYFPGEA